MKALMGTQDESGNDIERAQFDGKNVGKAERKISAIGGAAIVLLGLRQRSLGGLLVAGAGAAMIHRAATGQCSLYKKLGISTADTHGEAPTPTDYFEKGIHVEHSFTINRSAADLFQYWRDFKNLPTFMTHLKSVEDSGNGKSHWVASAPAGRTVEWDAKVINEEQDKLIAWKSLGGADIDHAGSVRFVPAHGDRGTIVKVVLDYIPPAGKIGSLIAKLFGEEPGQQIKDDLRRFKQLMESGETAVVDQRVRGNA